jgi:hypothetical protein
MRLSRRPLMRNNRHLFSCRTLFFFGLFMLSSPAQAQDGPRVIGMYGVKEITDLGPEARVTLRIRLINRSDSDLSDARMKVRSLLPLAKSAATISPVFLRPRSDVDFTQEVIIPRAELALWEKGARLLLTIQFRNAEGREASQTVALRWMPILEREQ